MKRLTLFLLLLSLTPLHAVAAEKVLVLGGTGRLGAEVVRERSPTATPSAYARSNASRARLADAKVEYVTGDLGALRSSTRQLAVRPTVVIDASGRAPMTSHTRTRSRCRRSSRLHAMWAPGRSFSSVRLAPVRTSRNSRIYPGVEYLPLLEERGIAERALTGSGVPFTIIRTGNVPGIGGSPVRRT